MVPSQWWLILALTVAHLSMAFGAAGVQADEPEREFSVTGRATINGEPARQGAKIAIEVNGEITGLDLVSGDSGKWVP